MLIPFIRTLILYLAVIAAIRFMGKRQVGEMQPSELVITILISAVASVPMQDVNIPLSHGVVPIATLIAAEIIISAVSMKSIRLRTLLSGNPIPIIRDGEIDQKALKKLRLSADDVFEDLRLKEVFDLRRVRFAQMETNGQLSVLLNTSDSHVTPGMLGLSPAPEEPFHVIVNDGCLVEAGLRRADKDRRWLSGVISANGAGDVSDIFLLCADRRGNLIFARRDK